MIYEFSSLNLLAYFVCFSPPLFFYLIVPSRPLRSNVVKLLEVEQRRNEINEKKFDLELEALEIVSRLEKHIFFLFACTGGMSIYLTTKKPSAAAFAIFILLMCLFLAGSLLHIIMAKSRITTMNIVIMSLMEGYKNVREEAGTLMELEWNRKGRLAANVVDNSEAPVMNMDSFIARTMTICDDSMDFSDFEKVYYKMIYMSWGICGGIYILLCWSYHFLTITMVSTFLKKKYFLWFFYLMYSNSSTLILNEFKVCYVIKGKKKIEVYFGAC